MRHRDAVSLLFYKSTDDFLLMIKTVKIYEY